MIGLDPNVLVRFLVRDDEEQHQQVVAMMRWGAERGETFFVGDVVLAEVVWVLASRYRCTRAEVSSVVRQLAEVEDLVFESTDRVVRALRCFDKGKGGFAAYLIAERAHVRPRTALRRGLRRTMTRKATRSGARGGLCEFGWAILDDVRTRIIEACASENGLIAPF